MIQEPKLEAKTGMPAVGVGGPLSSPTAAKPLAAKLREHVQQTGALASSDIVAATEEQPSDTPDRGVAMAQTTVVQDKGPKEQLDPLVQRAGTDKEPGAIKADSGGTSTDIAGMEAAIGQRRAVTITPEEKAAFVDAIVHNRRLELSFDLCGGQIRVVVRSRTVPETQAIVAQQRRDFDNGSVKSQMDYVIRLRAMLMTAQVARYMDTEYPLMEEPLMAVAASDGKTAAPKWTPWINTWLGLGEAQFTMIWGCVQLFEDKYWRMIEDAKDQNFWNPAASTSK